MTGTNHHHWSEQVRQGDFSVIPAPFTWEQSVKFAHLIDGYDLTGSQAVGLVIACRVQDEFRATGCSTASALNLWVTIFFEHRWQYHSGEEMQDHERLMFNALCERLRVQLINLGSRERAGIIAAFTEPAAKVTP